MLKQFWSGLDNTERALLLGGGFTAVSAVFMGAVVARGLRSGLPVTVSVGPETRGLIADQVRQTNLTLDRLSSHGIPVYVLVGAKRIEDRRK